MSKVSTTSIAALEAAVERLGNSFDVEKSSITFDAARLGVSISPKMLSTNMAIEVGRFLIDKAVAEGVNVYDGTGALDQMLFEFFKSITDDAGVAEAAVFEFRKTLTEAASVTDADVILFYKGLANAASASDTTAVNFIKAAVDGSELSDAEVLAITKALFDTVGATDDVDGAASILDDQEMQFFKNVSESAGASDVLTRIMGYARSLADSAAITESEYVDFGKLLSDNAGVSDSILITLLYGFSNA